LLGINIRRFINHVKGKMKNISRELKKLRRMELSEIDPDIIVAGAKARLDYDIERVQRWQILRELKHIKKLLQKLVHEKEPKSN
jgi:hypothetical protein